MRTTDERMDQVLKRARAREAADRRRRQRAVAIGGGAISVVAVVAVGLGFALASGNDAPFSAESLGLMGSALSGSSVLGYVVVGLLGLALGAAVTTLAFKLGHSSSHGGGAGKEHLDDGADGNGGRCEP